MENDLLSNVRNRLELLFRAGIIKELRSASSSESFGDAEIVLAMEDARIHAVRERGVVAVEFAAAKEPERWFDSPTVLRFLGLHGWGSLTGHDAADVLERPRELIDQHGQSIKEAFSAASYGRTRKQLVALEQRSDQQRLGFDLRS
jgi:hypothetical protein